MPGTVSTAVLAALVAATPATRAAAGSAQASLEPADLFRHVSPAVVVVLVLDDAGSVQRQGSGVIVGRGRVVTNRHVVEGAPALRVHRGGEGGTATVLAIDRDRDIAWLGVPWLRAQAPERRASPSLEVGERVYSVGAPQGLELTLSEGLISALRRRGRAYLIQTTAPISAGSSGGGLFDGQGHLVGLTAFAMREGQNLNFALPTEWLDAPEQAREVPLPRVLSIRREPGEAAHLVIESDAALAYDYYSPGPLSAVLRLFEVRGDVLPREPPVAGGEISAARVSEDDVAGRHVVSLEIDLAMPARHRIWSEGDSLHLSFDAVPGTEP